MGVENLMYKCHTEYSCKIFYGGRIIDSDCYDNGGFKMVEYRR